MTVMAVLKSLEQPTVQIPAASVYRVELRPGQLVLEDAAAELAADEIVEVASVELGLGEALDE